MSPWSMPPVVAHRGASAVAPENTLAAMRAAVAAGATWAECDVRLAGDGVPVVVHDPTLERTTDGTGLVAATPAAELAGLDAGGWFAPRYRGERVPTLAALRAAQPALGLGFNIELKAEDEAAARATAAAVASSLATWPGPLVVSSFNRAALTALRHTTPDVPLGLLCGREIDAEVLHAAQALGAVSLHADRQAYDADAVRAVAQAGLRPAAYTVNDVEQAVRLWRMGVRTLITDRPADLLAFARACRPRARARHPQA